MTQLPGFAVHVDEAFALPTKVRDRLNADLTSTAPANVLAAVFYNPGEETALATNSTSFNALGPALLTTSFVAPASGKVTVDLAAHVNASSGQGFWALLLNGTLVPTTKTRVCGPITIDQGGRYSATMLLEGLTPGISYNIQWAAASSTGGLAHRFGGTNAVAGNGLSGAGVMIVRDAPF